MQKWWIAIALFVLVLWIIDLFSKNTTTPVILEGFVNGNYYYKKCSTYAIGEVLSDVFKKHGISQETCGSSKKDECSQWNIYLPCGYTNVEQELNYLHPENKKQLIFGIKGCDSIVSKNNIWKLLVKAYGRDGATKLMPKTYLTGSRDDLELFQKDFIPGQIYILKKNLHRQTGLKLSNNVTEILNTIKKDPAYTVIQEVLPDPLCVNGRKINLRVYILVVCFQGKTKAYRYSDGFIYYTPKPYKPGSMEDAVNITSGYVPRKVYQENPLTHTDLVEHLNKRMNLDPKKLFKGIDKLMAKVMEGVFPHLCTSEQLKNNKSFQLFGADVAPCTDLDSQLIEINKGPDMNGKDKRDTALKFKIQEDIFNILNVLEYDESDRENGFILFWEKEN